MSEKKSIKVLVIFHLAASLLLCVLLFSANANKAFVLKWLTGGLIASLGIQFLLYGMKPTTFKDKVEKHPDMP
jgi:hypothetical protein